MSRCRTRREREWPTTCAFFPIDRATIDYLLATGRDAASIARVDAYAKAQGLWRDPAAEPAFTGFDSCRRMLSLGSAVVSLTTVIEIDAEVFPAGKRRVPASSV